MAAEALVERQYTNILDRLVPVEEVERITKRRLRARQLRKLGRDGTFPLVRIGRRLFVDLVQLEEFVARGGEPAQAQG